MRAGWPGRIARHIAKSGRFRRFQSGRCTRHTPRLTQSMPIGWKSHRATPLRGGPFSCPKLLPGHAHGGGDLFERGHAGMRGQGFHLEIGLAEVLISGEYYYAHILHTEKDYTKIENKYTFQRTAERTGATC